MLITQVTDAIRDVINLSTPMLQVYLHLFASFPLFRDLTYKLTEYYHCGISTNYIHRAQYILYQLKNVTEMKRIVCGPYNFMASRGFE